MRFLLVSNRPDHLADFVAVLTEDGHGIDFAPTGAAALGAVSGEAPALCVIDETLPDMDGFTLVARIMQKNALIHTAVISALSDEDFHEAGEGLGILKRLPLEPGGNDARELLAALSQMV